ncbi:MAG: DUF554 domain-containing protein [Defluviitaleaceae bacterium]|nr:DUF554 domain-containing protein [Defluviitaleaceae bacterium]
MVAIIIGSGLGFLLKGRITEKMSHTIMKAMGLCVCIIGISGALGGDIMLMVVSLALGAFVGELLNIDGGLNRLGLWVQSKFGKDDGSSSFAQGFVTATLLFCVGAMAVVGSIDSGLRDDQSIIITKSIIDAVASMALASTFGLGVLFSGFMVFLYQGSIEFFAGYLQNVFTPGLIAQISAVGGVMILGVGANMVFDAKIKAANLLPGFLVAAGYYFLFLG